MLEFQPAIVRDAHILELPRPILTCRLRDSWDFQKFKIPRVDGDLISGVSLDGVEITLEGQIGSHEGELKLTEEAMLESLVELRGALQGGADSLYTLALYHAPEGEDVRHFRKCSTMRLEVDLSNQRIYSYAVVIHAADPVLYDGPLP
ncbi:hypothetical protein [Planctomicrobium sp. SH664]|uniref:hypothetical protein n=1 Tax=Planctomicrobium sp. SH664 TaxID=3448125 RepID=UPI003F5C945A